MKKNFIFQVINKMSICGFLPALLLCFSFSAGAADVPAKKAPTPVLESKAGLKNKNSQRQSRTKAQNKTAKTRKLTSTNEPHSRVRSVTAKQNRLKFLLSSLPTICQMQKTFEEKTAYMDQTMKELHTLSRELVNKHRSFGLALAIMNATEDNVNNFITADVHITPEKVKEVDLRNLFTISYSWYDSRVTHNSKVEDFPDEWGKQIYQGLDCLYQACGQDCSE